MANVGFLGLGIMGAPMAQHLISAGHNVTVWSHNTKKAQEFAEKNGATHAAKPADVARAAKYSFLCVGDTAMSQEVVLGENGLVAGAGAGSVIIDCSTVSPLASTAMYETLKKKQIRFLDAPCTGSKAGAEGGTLTFMVGGDKHIFEEVKPLFEAMGKMLYYCGPAGMGLRAKVTQNLILGNLLQAFNEGLVLSTKAGVDPELMLQILDNSAARSAFITGKSPAVLAGNFATNFSVRWLEKDLALSLELAGEIGAPMPSTAVAQQALRTAMAKGFGDDDICGSIRVLEDTTGVQVRSKKS
jgi:3-hydroxyisobutyrate dehydrogenase-like beta-hydroxyacid dehydrogenase